MDYVGHDMPSSPLDRTDGRTTMGIACYHRPWTALMVVRRWVLHVIITFGQYTRLDYVTRCMPISPLDCTYIWTTSGVACTHGPCAAQSVRRHRAWYVIIALGKHTRSDFIGRAMLSFPLDITDDWTTSCGMPAWLLGSTHVQTTLGVACHQ